MSSSISSVHLYKSRSNNSFLLITTCHTEPAFRLICRWTSDYYAERFWQTFRSVICIVYFVNDLWNYLLFRCELIFDLKHQSVLFYVYENDCLTVLGRTLEGQRAKVRPQAIWWRTVKEERPGGQFGIWPTEARNRESCVDKEKALYAYCCEKTR